MSALSGTDASGILTRQTGATPNKFSALSSEQFVKIMFTELTNQDPLKPNDSNQLLQQMSSLREIESSISLQTKLDDLVGQNAFSSASLLIGAKVSGITDANQRVQGLVASVVKTNEGPILTLRSGERINFNNVDQVWPADFTAPPTTPPVTPPGNGGGNTGGGSGGSGGGGGGGGATSTNPNAGLTTQPGPGAPPVGDGSGSGNTADSDSSATGSTGSRPQD
jgi:hypothetical protein